MDQLVTDDKDIANAGWTPEYEETWGDRMLRPDKPLLQRHLELARMAAHGKTNNEIAEKLGYTASRVSILLSNRRIKNQINIYRDRLFKVDVKTRMKDIAPDAMDVIEGILNDDNLDAKQKEKAAMWVLEKVDGKAAQQVDHNVSGGIGLFLDKLDQMKSQGNLPTVQTLPAEAVKVTESNTEATSKDEFTTWLNENLKDEA